MKLDTVSRDRSAGITSKAQIMSLFGECAYGRMGGRCSRLRLRSPQFFFKLTKEKLLNDSNATTLVLVLRQQTNKRNQTDS